MKKLATIFLAVFLGIMAFFGGCNSTDGTYTTRGLWHFSEYVASTNSVFFHDDDSNNPGRNADLQLYDGSTAVQTGGSSGPLLIDPQAAGIGYPNGDSTFGKCIYFDGVNDLAQVDSTKVPIDPTNFWIGGWVKLPDAYQPNLAPNSPSNVMMLFERYGQVAIRIVDNTGAGGLVIQPMFWNADGTFLGFYGVDYVTIGVDFHQWHQIAVEVKGNIAKCYVNGTVRGTWTLATNGVAATPVQPYTRFGLSYNTTAQYPFWGYIDEWHVESSRTVNYPAITSQTVNGSTMVYWGSNLIVEVRNNRLLRFRATGANDHWVGKQTLPMDLCWEMYDSQVNDYVVQNATFTNNPTDGRFTINITATKPSVTGTVTSTIDGYWNPFNQKFHYMLTQRLQCPLESWYLKSSHAPTIEVLDYFIEYNSWPDVYGSSNPNHAKLYQWEVFSPDGVSMTRLPKISLPYPTRPGNYITGSTGNMPKGCYWGFFDLVEGGWMSQVVDGPSQINYAPCWMFFDVHTYLQLPARGSQTDLDVTFKQHFVTIEPQEVGQILANSSEIDWKTKPEYQLPILTRNNTFNQLITDTGNSDKYMWWASSYDCLRATDMGYDDNYSVTINHGTNDKSAAWYARCWGLPYDSENISGNYKIKAKIKTSGCTGAGVRLGVAQCSGDYWIYGSGYNPLGANWTYSPIVLSGTNNWTDVEVTTSMPGPLRHIVLEQRGPGQSWFDNVTIEKLP